MKLVCLLLILGVGLNQTKAQMTFVTNSTTIYEHNPIEDEWQQKSIPFTDTSYFEFKKEYSEVLHTTAFGSKAFTVKSHAYNDSTKLFIAQLRDNQSSSHTLTVDFKKETLTFTNNINEGASMLIMGLMGFADNDY